MNFLENPISEERSGKGTTWAMALALVIITEMTIIVVGLITQITRQIDLAQYPILERF